MNLSKAELRVAKLAALGFSTKDIAEKLFITESCIKGHLRFIYKKMGCSGRSQLIAKHGLAIQSMELPEISATEAPKVQFESSRDRDFTAVVSISEGVIESIDHLPRGACDTF